MLKNTPELTCQITYYKPIGFIYGPFIGFIFGPFNYRIGFTFEPPCNYTTKVTIKRVTIVIPSEAWVGYFLQNINLKTDFYKMVIWHATLCYNTMLTNTNICSTHRGRQIIRITHKISKAGGDKRNRHYLICDKVSINGLNSVGCLRLHVNHPINMSIYKMI